MEKNVRKDVGVWIDHRKAVIATAGKGGVPIQCLASNMEKHVRFSGAAISGEDIRDRRFANHLERYYAAVTAVIRDAESILLLGPGEAKLELTHHLEREGLGERIVGVDTADKMTDRQISAKIGQYFERLNRTRYRDKPRTK
jgi:hypothetical protein